MAVQPPPIGLLEVFRWDGSDEALPVLPDAFSVNFDTPELFFQQKKQEEVRRSQVRAIGRVNEAFYPPLAEEIADGGCSVYQSVVPVENEAVFSAHIWPLPLYNVQEVGQDSDDIFSVDFGSDGRVVLVYRTGDVKERKNHLLLP